LGQINDDKAAKQLGKKEYGQHKQIVKWKGAAVKLTTIIEESVKN